MKTKGIPSKWLHQTGRRLDCGPYLSGGLEAKILLENARAPKMALRQVTLNGLKGIFNGPRFARAYVESPEFGVPFLGSTDILDADLSRLPYISKRQAASRPELLIDSDWTLITCSGTIGRMAYSRIDMKGMAGSQHFMRVVPDRSTIPPGYLYAFMSSKFGVPQVVGGTYGAIIQHIEPEHIADLPVPRLSDEIEDRAHRLVDRAASLRTEASRTLALAVDRLEQACGLTPPRREASPTPHDVASALSTSLRARMDAFFHSRYHTEVVRQVANCDVMTMRTSELAVRIFEPARFKRISVDESEGAVPFFGTSPLLWADPKPNRFLSRSFPGVEQYLVGERTILVPRSGQLSGIIGTSILPYGPLVGGAVSEDAIRIECPSAEDAGFLFVALTSQFGLRQLKARACGSSIPHLDVSQIGQVLVPVPSPQIRSELGCLGARVAHLRGQAIGVEAEARQIVERAIEEAT